MVGVFGIDGRSVDGFVGFHQIVRRDVARTSRETTRSGTAELVVERPLRVFARNILDIKNHLRVVLVRLLEQPFVTGKEGVFTQCVDLVDHFKYLIVFVLVKIGTHLHTQSRSLGSPTQLWGVLGEVLNGHVIVGDGLTPGFILSGAGDVAGVLRRDGSFDQRNAAVALDQRSVGQSAQEMGLAFESGFDIVLQRDRLQGIQQVISPENDRITASPAVSNHLLVLRG